MFRSLPPLRRRSRGLKPFRRCRARLGVEELESRTLLSVYTPIQISSAYGFNNVSFPSGSTTVKGDGTGQTIAIVDAYWDPTIQQDLMAFNSRYGLPQLDGKGSDGTFVQTYTGPTQPPTSPSGDDWTVETALDVEWAHAMAPKANIVLVEAQSDNTDASGKPTDLLNAVQLAATTSVNGSPVVAVSMSWGVSESPNETSWDSYFTTNQATGKPLTGVTFLAASGDSGAGTIWPAVSPDVVAVGGTSLKLTNSNTISSETGWGNGQYSWYFGGSGGGFSQYEPLPTYQQNIPTVSGGFKLTSFGARLSPDVAYDANPNTGVYVLDHGTLYQVGGTSVGAPQWAALVAIADQGRKVDGQAPLSSSDTLSALYGIYNSSSYTSDFRDITSGNSTGTYNVYNSSGQVIGHITVAPQSGYDLVTGIGSPRANALAVALSNAGTGSPGAPPLVAGSGTSGSSGSGNGKTPPAVLAADAGAAAAVPPTSGNSGSSSGTLPGGSTTSATGPSATLATQAGLALTNGSVVHGMPTLTNAAPPSLSVPLPTVAPLPPTRAAGSANLIQLSSGGGDLLNIDDQSGDDQATPVPGPRSVPNGNPQAPIPGLDNIAPDMAYPQDRAVVRAGSVPVFEPEQAPAGLANLVDEAVSRLEPSFAMAGLTFAMVWHWRGHTSPSDDDERRRREQGAE
jgi:hypothetical protein